MKIKKYTNIEKINNLMIKKYSMFRNEIFFISDKYSNNGSVAISSFRSDSLSYYYSENKNKLYVKTIFKNFPEINRVTYGIKEYKR